MTSMFIMLICFAECAKAKFTNPGNDKHNNTFKNVWECFRNSDKPSLNT